MKLLKIILLTSALSLAVSTNAQHCNENITVTAPDSRFIDNGNGTATDRQTNLIWMRCSLGQSWNQSQLTCTGNVDQFTWQEALQEADGYTYAGSSDWRVPNLRELMSIVELSCHYPAINETIFPQTPVAWFWSSSPYAYTGRYAWNIDFYTGYEQDSAKSNERYVRLVRSTGD